VGDDCTRGECELGQAAVIVILESVGSLIRKNNRSDCIARAAVLSNSSIKPNRIKSCGDLERRIIYRVVARISRRIMDGINDLVRSRGLRNIDTAYGIRTPWSKLALIAVHISSGNIGTKIAILNAQSAARWRERRAIC